MLFMVIERFKNCDPIPVYRRVRDPGIKFPEGLKYVGSWIEPNFDRCFQLMECDDARLLQEWILNCQGLGMTFEIVPVVPSKETREVVAPYLLPELLAADGGRVTNQPTAGDDQTFEVHVKADYLGRTARQTLRYRYTNDRWSLTDASLDAAPR